MINRSFFLSLMIPLVLSKNVLQAQMTTTVSFDCKDSIPAWMAQSKVPAVGVGIIEDGRIKTIQVFGDLREHVPAPANTLFNVASLTKPITAMLTLKLVNAGKWDLDEPLSKYWIDPDLKGDPRYEKITTRIILSHRTGFPNWRSNSASKKLGFDFEPGTKFGYSGEGFEYLRRALEKKFGETLQQLADSILFQPLGMKDTRYGWAPQLDSSRYAVPHDDKGAAIDGKKSATINAADWLITTAADYTAFGTYVLHEAGLSKQLFNDMITPEDTIKNGPPLETMGLCWEVIKDLPGGEYLLMHTGHDDGVFTLILLLPKSGRGLVVLTNGENGMGVIVPILKATMQIKELTH